eukprot:31091-Hanusia_phi.AAC.1
MRVVGMISGCLDGDAIPHAGNARVGVTRWLTDAGCKGNAVRTGGGIHGVGYIDQVKRTDDVDIGAHTESRIR